MGEEGRRAVGAAGRARARLRWRGVRGEDAGGRALPGTRRRKSARRRGYEANEEPKRKAGRGGKLVHSRRALLAPRFDATV